MDAFATSRTQKPAVSLGEGVDGDLHRGPDAGRGRARVRVLAAVLAGTTLALSACASSGSGKDAADLAAPAAPAASAAADATCTQNNAQQSPTQLTYTGAVQSVTVPDGVCGVIITAIGGGGGFGYEDDTLGQNPTHGASGAAITNALTQVSPGDTLLVSVGGAGQESQSSRPGGAGGWGGIGGTGGVGGIGSKGTVGGFYAYGGGAGGGGATVVQTQHGSDDPQLVVVAGGAGGGSTGGAQNEVGYNGNTQGGNAGTHGPTSNGTFMIWQGDRGSNGSGTGGGGGGLPGVPSDPPAGGLGGDAECWSCGAGGGGGGGYQGGYGGNGSDSTKMLNGGGGGGAGSTAVLTSAWINGFTTVDHATDAQGGKNGYVTITFLLASS